MLLAVLRSAEQTGGRVSAARQDRGARKGSALTARRGATESRAVPEHTESRRGGKSADDIRSTVLLSLSSYRFLRASSARRPGGHGSA